MRILGLIPARGGSKGIPGKNLYPLAGKPLIAWTIEAALESGVFEDVIVSTDDMDIAVVAKAYGADIPFLRPEKLATDCAQTVDVAIHALKMMKLWEQQYTHVCVLQPTSPLRTGDNIKEAHRMLSEYPVYGVVSVVETDHSPLWSSTLPDDFNMGGFKVKPENRQHLPKYYQLNGAIYFIEVDTLLRERSFLGFDTRAYVMPRKESIDIDSMVDIELAELLLEKRRFSEEHYRETVEQEKLIEDLMGRRQVPLDLDSVRDVIDYKSVLITGASGSIGSEIARQVYSLNPKKLILVDIDESGLYDLRQDLLRQKNTDALITSCHLALCDIRDKSSLLAVFEKTQPDIVFHAAAYKHVPILEDEPREAILTNVMGTRNVIDCCVETNVHRLLSVSTDKAVHPACIMGLTKAVAELLITDAYNRFGLNASLVRLGNVLGSRGSFLPLFKRQLAQGGPITVTHPDVTRYLMTIPEAASLIIKAMALSEGGELFVLDMGEPVKIDEIARALRANAGIPANIVYTGLRPGEKLHEVLTMKDEELEATEKEKIFKVKLPLDLSEFLQMYVLRLVCSAEDYDDRYEEYLRKLVPNAERWESADACN